MEGVVLIKNLIVNKVMKMMMCQFEDFFYYMKVNIFCKLKRKKGKL